MSRRRCSTPARWRTSSARPEAATAQAAAQYRSTVLVAFQNVADVLRALQSDARAVTAAIAAERSANRSIDLVRRQVEQGQVSIPILLNAQQAYLQTSLARVQAEAARLADTVALFQALGGGWWNRPQPTLPSRSASEAHDASEPARLARLQRVGSHCCRGACARLHAPRVCRWLAALAGDGRAPAAKNADIVRVTDDQMHQLNIVPVELYDVPRARSRRSARSPSTRTPAPSC